MDLHQYSRWAGQFFEAAGIVAMLAGTLWAAFLAVGVARTAGGSQAYRVLRQNVGRSILLGLEFLVAADIIRTVGEIPTLEDVSVLAIIVVIRTFLSIALEVELEGRWPWQARPAPDEEPRERRP